MSIKIDDSCNGDVKLFSSANVEVGWSGDTPQHILVNQDVNVLYQQILQLSQQGFSTGSENRFISFRSDDNILFFVNVNNIVKVMFFD